MPTKTRLQFSYADFLNDLPALHSWDGGKNWNTGGFERCHLEPLERFLREHLPADAEMLETGAGCSTIAMLLMRPKRLISIEPDPQLSDRILEFCDARNIERSALEVCAEKSEWYLPLLAATNRDRPFLDFALIDGAHSWPYTFIDLFYSSAMLKVGGFLMIDDLELHSIKEMARLLDKQPGVSMALDLGKARVYRRAVGSEIFGEWADQPYIVSRSQEYAHWNNPFANEVMP